MGFLNFFKEKQYEQEVQKMNGPQVFGLLDLMSPEMKKMLLSQISGIDANFPKEQQERMDKLLEAAQKLPASEKLKLLKEDKRVPLRVKGNGRNVKLLVKVRDPIESGELKNKRMGL